MTKIRTKNLPPLPGVPLPGGVFNFATLQWGGLLMEGVGLPNHLLEVYPVLEASSKRGDALSKHTRYPTYGTIPHENAIFAA